MNTKSVSYPVDTTIIKDCMSCDGVWLSGVSVSRLIETQKSKIKTEELVQSSKDNQNLSETRNCPECDSKPLNVVMIRGIELDFCEFCNGVYFDKGELNYVIPNLQKPYSSRDYQIKQSDGFRKDVVAIVNFDILLQGIASLFS